MFAEAQLCDDRHKLDSLAKVFIAQRRVPAISIKSGTNFLFCKISLKKSLLTGFLAMCNTPQQRNGFALL